MSDSAKHTPPTLDWRFIPSHIAEGPSEVRHVDGWLVCETCSDEYARLMAAAPDTTDALRKLVNEVSALGGFGPEVEALIGVTNWRVLMMRVQEAREALAKAGVST